MTILKETTMSQHPPGPFQPGFGLLATALEVAVPLRMMELIRDGGPVEADFARIARHAEDLIAHGDDLLFRNEKQHATATRFNQLADAIAVLSFAPGGITVCGAHFDGCAMKECRAACPSHHERREENTKDA